MLVPIDFSKCSKNALKIAIDIAKKSRAKLHLVNAVHMHTPYPDFEGGSMMDAIIEDYESQVKDSFAELESEFIELKEIPHESDRYVTYFTDAIHVEIDSKDIDLVIMGTRSDHDSIDFLIGTNSWDIVARSNVPVLVIPENFTEFNPNKIAFASDFMKVNDEAKYKILSWLAGLYNSEVLVFHVSEEPIELTAQQEKQMNIIQEKLKNVNSSVRTCLADSLVEGVLDFVEQHEIDILAMMPRKHNLFERIFKKSTSKSFVINPVMPILTFHDV